MTSPLFMTAQQSIASISLFDCADEDGEIDLLLTATPRSSDSSWSAVCSTTLLLPEIDSAGLDVCSVRGVPKVFLYEKHDEVTVGKGIDCLTALCHHFGFDLHLSQDSPVFASLSSLSLR